MKTTIRLSILVLALIGFSAQAQYNPNYQWTLLDQSLMDDIIGEASGETAFNHILEMGAYNRNRPAKEYETTLWEAEYTLLKLKEYGLPGAKIERFPSGRQTWDGISGDLWEISPAKRKIADYQDLRAMIASGSQSVDVEAELIWVDEGRAADFEGLDVTGKIVVTSGSPRGVSGVAVRNGALGVVSFNSPRPLVDPIQIPWTGVSGRGAAASSGPVFGFMLPPREGHILRDRLMRGEKIKVHAKVESEMKDLDLQVPTCVIPGTDSNADEVIFSAHLFEGYTKQGANDNISGSAAILEVARILHSMIEEGRLPRPKRSIRFIWVPEFSGTGPWVVEHKDIMKRTLCNINLDMVGLWLSKSQSSFNLERTTFGNAHYINDVMENYFRYVGETNRVSLVLSGRGGYVNRIVAPSGSDEPFYYAIEHHYGASDHEVFNDWGVGVPGVMMITWPDNYYHTSEDRPDKCDPTQLKRCCVIGAAAAYTIAASDSKMARKIVGETFTNGSKRISQEASRSFNELSKANAENLSSVYRLTRGYIEAAALNEVSTLETINELYPSNSQLKTYIAGKQKLIDQITQSQMTGIDQLMASKAEELGVKPVSLAPNKLEKKAMTVIPVETDLVKANGYQGYREAMQSSGQSGRRGGPSGIANSGELQRLCNGRYNALQIKKLLDTEYRSESDLQAILDYIDLLKNSGLVTLK